MLYVCCGYFIFGGNDVVCEFVLVVYVVECVFDVVVKWCGKYWGCVYDEIVVVCLMDVCEWFVVFGFEYGGWWWYDVRDSDGGGCVVFFVLSSCSRTRVSGEVMKCVKVCERV